MKNYSKIDNGFFVQEHVNNIIVMKSIETANKYAMSVIDAFIDEHPNVHKENILKVKALVSKAKSPQQLAIGIQNFILAHPSEGLKVI